MEEATAQQVHRGPDEVGFASGDWWALGHSRLAITNPSTQKEQPFRSNHSNWVVLFNGEIYNHQVLRFQLGLPADDGSDGYVIPHILDRYGPDGLKILRGMYAILAIDVRSRSVLIANDPFGIKSIYFMRQDSALLVASELKVFRQAMKRRSISSQDISHFLERGTFATSRTGYEEIERLRPATWHSISQDGSFQTGSTSTAQLRSYVETTWEEAYTKFRNYTSMTIPTEAPSAVLLSGGTDSAAVAEVVAEQRPGIPALTLSFQDLHTTEVLNAAATARELALDHIVVEARLSSELSEGFLSAMDRPTIDGLNMYLASRAAKDLGFSALLTGIGGDEILTGYLSWPSYIAAQIMRSRVLQRTSPIPEWLIRRVARPKIMQRFMADEGFRWPRNPSEYVSLRRRVFQPAEINEALITRRSWMDEQAPRVETLAAKGVNGYSAAQIRQYLQTQLLPDADVFAMANSVEVRVPFLDEEFARIVEAVAHRAPSKQGFVKASKSSTLHRVASRPKEGFSIPIQDWLTSGPLSMYVDTLLAPEARIHGYVSSRFTRDVVIDWRKGARPWFQLWSLVVLNEWLERRS